MTRDQFITAAGALYDMLAGDSPAPAPTGAGNPDAKMPRFDTVIYRGSGMVSYASECSAKELRFHLARAEKPASDPKWQESNEKKARSLRFFLEWRTANPSAIWTGERNRVQVTAKPPSDRPEQYPRDAMSATSTPAPTPRFDEAEDEFSDAF